MEDVARGPRHSLSVVDAVAIVVGVVVGAGIFQFPQMVARSTGGGGWFMAAWAIGGLVSLIGALCYAELASAYPDAGGDYHFLMRAWGGPPSFLFAWARMTVIQTGSIALQALILGQYASELLNLGPFSASIYAAAVIALLTLLNLAGIHVGKWAQNLLTACIVLGLLLVGAAGVYAALRSPAATTASHSSSLAMGQAMVFVLLTYGGWNEAAYISAEVRGGRRGMLRVLLWSIGLITLIYLLVNAAYLLGLGIPGLKGSSALAADLLRRSFGEGGARMVSVLIAVAILSTTNGTILTGARTTYALGRDFPLLGALGGWDHRRNTPAAALIAQGLIALGLVLLGTLAGRGAKTIDTLVAYTSPVFWFFFLLVGVSLFVLRYRDPAAPRPFRVPFYPVTPLIFCGVSAYMLWSSLDYARFLASEEDFAAIGAWAGVGVFLAGVPLMLFAGRASRAATAMPAGD